MLCKHYPEGRCQNCGLILPKRRPKYHSDDCYKDFLNNHLWRFAKIEAMRRSSGKCVICKDGTPAREVHHKIKIDDYQGYSCLHHQSNLQPVCREHHNDLYHSEAKLEEVPVDGLVLNAFGGI